MKDITIRKAVFEDAAEIANVHINSWQEAYVGLLPQQFLNERPLAFKNRYDLWKRVTKDLDQVTLVAQSVEHGVVGFINGKNGRDEGLNDYCEVWCIYLLKKYHAQKIGFNLLKKYFDVHIEKGYSKGYLWVLDENPTIKFYEKAGAEYHGRNKQESIAGIKVQELMYLWHDIRL